MRRDHRLLIDSLGFSKNQSIAEMKVNYELGQFDLNIEMKTVSVAIQLFNRM